LIGEAGRVCEREEIPTGKLIDADVNNLRRKVVQEIAGETEARAVATPAG
jgi:hypothetical protein